MRDRIQQRLTRAEAAHSRERLSDLLGRLARREADTITLNELVRAVGDRAFGAIILVLAFPNLVAAAIPGVSTLLGIPLMLVSLQLTIGAGRVWLPRAARARPVSRPQFAKLVAKVQPWLQRVERLLRPRLVLLTSTWAERCIGLLCLISSAVLFLPIPFANFLPALVLCFLGLSLLERDGFMVLLGLLTFTVTSIMLGGALLTIKAIVVKLFEHAFSA
jgi:hypothetical protein